MRAITEYRAPGERMGIGGTWLDYCRELAARLEAEGRDVAVVAKWTARGKERRKKYATRTRRVAVVERVNKEGSEG
jgi:hypothetical protein